MYKFNCPHCRKSFSAKEDAAGRRTKCPKCATPFRIPVLEVSTADLATPLDGASAPQNSQENTPSGMKKWKPASKAYGLFESEELDSLPVNPFDDDKNFLLNKKAPEIPVSITTIPEWYYLIDGKKNGPVAIGTLKEAINSNRISAATLVWKAGMKEWMPFGNIYPDSPPLPMQTPKQPSPPGMDDPYEMSRENNPEKLAMAIETPRVQIDYKNLFKYKKTICFSLFVLIILSFLSEISEKQKPLSFKDANREFERRLIANDPYFKDKKPGFSDFMWNPAHRD